MIAFDPGSFRDPAGRVFLHDTWACRTMSAAAREHLADAERSGLIASLVRDGLLVDSTLVTAESLGLAAREVGEVVLRQPRLPVVTYPYEWSFEMLRDAALTTLRTLDRALAHGFTLKDAPAFNVLFEGTHPRLVDTPSLERYREGEIWTGYSQFCRAFLFPLLLAAYQSEDIQALLRGYLGEVPAADAARRFGLRDYWRPGVLKDVIVQARLDRSFAGAQGTVKATTAGRQYPRALFVANVQRLIRLIEALPAPPARTEWSAYDTFQSYNADDRATKAAFVERTLRQGGSGRVADLGANIGEYSDIALRTGATVVAVDIDPGAIDRLYRAHPRTTALSPIVASLLNPTPALGWGLRERASLFARIGSDRFLALALIHHLRITGGVPLTAIVEQLFAIAPEGIVEWVDKRDAMVARMLSLRRDVFDDYHWAAFEEAVTRVGTIVATAETHGGARRLCHVRARPRSSGA